MKVSASTHLWQRNFHDVHFMPPGFPGSQLNRPQPQGPSLLHRLHCPVEEWYPNMGNPWKSTTSILPIYSHIFQVKAQGPCTLGISQPCFMALSGHPTSHPTSSRSSRPSCFRSIATRASSSSLFRSRNCTFACNAHGIPLW